MIAKVTIIDDNGNPKGAYELKPSRIYEGGISTKYVFEFEYNQLNYDKNMAEIETQEGEKINCKSTKCENCINHNYCDFESQESEDKE